MGLRRRSDPRRNDPRRNDLSKHPDYLPDVLSLLHGWVRDGREFRRTLSLDESQHAALAERIKVVADALHLRPEVRRMDGFPMIRLYTPVGTGLSHGEIALAARIEELYRAVAPT